MKDIKEKLKKINLKEMWKDKRGRAKIELSLYLIFFLIVLVFARVSSSSINNNINNNNKNNTSNSFINEIKDNYEENISVNINENIYTYHIVRLGNNTKIERKDNDNENFYYIMNDKYYELDSSGNYILTTKEEVYPYLNYNYLNIDNIKNFISSGTKEDNNYKVKVSDIILNSTSNDDIIITINEDDKSMNINYTNLLKIDDSSISTASVTMIFTNIDKIISLEE